MTDDYPSTSSTIRKVVQALCLLCGASAIAIALAAAFQPLIAADTKSAWILAGFECVVAVASALGWAFGRDYFRAGPGLALACIAGSILLASALGALSAQWAVGPVKLVPVVALRGLIALALGFCGVCVVLNRDPRAWPVFIKGVIAGTPLMLLAAWFGIKGGAFMAPVLGLSTALKLIVLGIGAMILAISLCISVHLVVKAFEFGRFAQDEMADGPAKRPI